MKERRWGGVEKKGREKIEEGREKGQAEKKKRRQEEDKEDCVQLIYQTVNLERERPLYSFIFL